MAPIVLSRTHKSWAGTLLTLAIVLVFLRGCSAFVPPLHRLLHHIPYLFPDDATGTVTATGDFGNWTMHVDQCLSGERRQYFGAAFSDHAQPTLGGHIALPEDGEAHIDIDTPQKGGSDVIQRGGCQVWDVDLQRSNSTYNNVYAITGHARFDCTFQNPDAHLAGDVQFRSCH